MCEPTTWIMLASLAMTAISGQQQRSAAKANEEAGKILAEDAIDRGEADEEAHRRTIAAFKGKQAAIFGASGAEINTGSSAEILADTAQIGELEALRIRNNAEREAFGFLVGVNISAERARSAVFSTILTSASTVISGQQAGAFDFGSTGGGNVTAQNRGRIGGVS